MHMAGQTSIASRRADFHARQNPLDLRVHPTSALPQQPKPLDRVHLAIRHHLVAPSKGLLCSASCA